MTVLHQNKDISKAELSENEPREQFQNEEYEDSPRLIGLSSRIMKDIFDIYSLIPLYFDN